MKKFEVIIIGAGPAGLTLSYHLKKLGITHLILEKASTAGHSWGNMPDHLSLVSLWKSNYLIREDKNYFPYFSAVKAKDFHQYLMNFGSKHSLPVSFETEVLDVKKVNSVFKIQTSQGDFEADKVVNCTGYYSFPWIPENLKAIKSLPLIHMKDFKNAQQFKDYKKILLVGKRLSAGQIIEELASDHTVGISTRSPLKFSSHPLIYKFFLILLDEFEACVKYFKPKFKEEIEVKMEAKVKPFFSKNAIQIFPEIESVRGNTVTFRDQRTEQFDAIICATGFIPTWPYLELQNPLNNLKDHFESSEIPGLYFLGFSSQRNFVSRFLRGIREDALILANLIAGKDPRKK